MKVFFGCRYRLGAQFPFRNRNLGLPELAGVASVNGTLKLNVLTQFRAGVLLLFFIKLIHQIIIDAFRKHNLGTNKVNNHI